jgi:hypothetical protein
VTITSRVGSATPLPRQYGGLRGGLPSCPAPRQMAFRTSCKTGEGPLPTRHSSLACPEESEARRRVTACPWPPWRLINGAAIRITANSLKTGTRHPVRSTVKGALGASGELFSLATSHLALITAVLIDGSAIRKPRKPLKTRLRDHLRSTVNGGIRVGNYSSQLTMSKSRITSHKLRVTGNGSRDLFTACCINGNFTFREPARLRYAPNRQGTHENDRLGRT